ncbi:acyltransferase family protein [Bacteroides graminisolvens]
MYSYVSLAKGFGILLVIAGHFTTVKYAPGFYNAFRDWIYAFHMPLFMSLSGFLFAYSLKRSSGQLPFWSFVRKKFTRLMVPYFFVSAVIALIKWYFPKGRIVNYGYLTDLLYMNVGGVAVFLWFLYALFLIFLIAAVFVQFKRGHMAMGVVALPLFFMTLPDVFFLSYVKVYLLYFWLGMCLFMAADKKVLRLSLKEMWVALLLFIPVYACRTMGHDGFLRNLENLLCGTLCSYAVICFCNYLNRYTSVIQKSILHVGKQSAAIYLMHMAGVSLVCVWYEKLAVFTPLTYLVALIVAVIMGVGLSLLANKYLVSSNKYVNWLMGGN